MCIGNSRPRVFPTFPEPTATTTKKRAKANTGAKRGPKKATATKGSKPTGVTKKAPAKKPTTAAKVRHFGRASVFSLLIVTIGQNCCQEGRRRCEEGMLLSLFVMNVSRRVPKLYKQMSYQACIITSAVYLEAMEFLYARTFMSISDNLLAISCEWSWIFDYSRHPLTSLAKLINIFI